MSEPRKRIAPGIIPPNDDRSIKYEFTPEFTRAVVFYACSSPKFYRRVGGQVHVDCLPHYGLEPVEADAHRLVLSAAHAWNKTHGAPPSRAGLVLQQLRNWQYGGTVSEEQLAAVSKFFDGFEDNPRSMPEEDTVRALVPILQARLRLAAVRLVGEGAMKRDDKEIDRAFDVLAASKRLGEPSGASAPSISELIDRAASEQTAPRLKSGFETLDSIITHGGFPYAQGIVTLQGPPGVGKNGVAAQWVHRWIAAGIPVAVLAGDEPTSAWVMRLAQHGGQPRTLLETDPDAWGEAKKVLCALPITLIDADETGLCAEDAADLLPDAAARVLIVDLIQTSRSKTSSNAKDAKTRVDAVMDDLKRIAKRPGMLVVALSEVGRGAYRSRAERTDPLASGKESGAIESRSAVVLDLSNPEGTHGTVDVLAAKTRWGRKGTRFRLVHEPEFDTYAEIALPDADEGSPLDQAKERVREVLTTHHDLKSATAVYTEAGGTKSVVLRAVREMLTAGEIVMHAGFLRLASEVTP
jgi:hypothetical protein